jgi:hypothetical protein
VIDVEVLDDAALVELDQVLEDRVAFVVVVGDREEAAGRCLHLGAVAVTELPH